MRTLVLVVASFVSYQAHALRQDIRGVENDVLDATSSPESGDVDAMPSSAAELEMGSNAVSTSRVAAAGQTLHKGRFVLDSLITSRVASRPWVVSVPLQLPPTVQTFHAAPIGVQPAHFVQAPLHPTVFVQPTPFTPMMVPQAQAVTFPRQKPGEEGAFPVDSLSDAERNAFHEDTYLGQGAFGDVWKAFDTENQRDVAVKIFYSTKTGRQEYLTWNSADARERDALRTNAQECQLAIQLMNNAAVSPVGASRICGCYEEHVLDKESSAGDEVTFIVLELCGSSLKKRREKMKSSPATDRQAFARKVVKQLMEGLDFLTQMSPPLLHHDMKVDNVVALGDNGDPSVKIIDFGCFVWANDPSQESMGDLRYMPPDFASSAQAYTPGYPDRFDVYSTGLLYAELLCPSLQVEQWKVGNSPVAMATLKSSMQMSCPDLRSGAEEDFKLIENMIQPHAQNRPNPMQAYAYIHKMGETQAAQPARPMGQLILYRKGQQVDYNSISLGQWVPATVLDVSRDHQGYYLIEIAGSRQQKMIHQNRLRARLAVAPSIPVIQLGVKQLMFQHGDQIWCKAACGTAIIGNQLAEYKRGVVSVANNLQDTYDIFLPDENALYKDVKPMFVFGRQ